MGRYDRATRDFMEKLAGDGTPHRQEETLPPPTLNPAKDALRAAKSVVRAVQTPVETLSRQSIGLAASHLLKMASVAPMRIFAMLNERYGRDWWDWEPETLWRTIEQDLDTEADEEVKNLIQAFQLIVHTNAPFEHWHIFEKVGHALNANPVDFGIVQPLELDEAAWTVHVLKTMRPQQPFDDEVDAYIAACAKGAGVVYLPPELFPADAQAALDRMNNDLGLKAEVKAISPGTDTADIPLKVQLGRLKECADYVKEHA